MKHLAQFFVFLSLTCGQMQGRDFKELGRFSAVEARQGVAVDAEAYYVISNHAIGKYSKSTQAKLAHWECDEGEPLIHLNAGIVYNGRLYCAHSNYPGVPMTSSIEVFDTSNLQHVESHSFGIFWGSLTWIDRKDDAWYACFAHYSNRAAEPNRDPSWSVLIKFDDQWTRQESWIFPSKLIEAFDGYSSSGGGFGPDGSLYVTGHDHPQLYALEFPDGGSQLIWKNTIEISAEGQAFAWDPTSNANFVSILKREREVILGHITMSP